MKSKYILLYVVVGIAFLGASAWVYITRSKNAKALRAKYRLGGILLTCMAMLSVASCGEVPDPEVMCYDPCPDDYVTYETIRHDADWNFILSPGEMMTVAISCPTFPKYRLVLSKTVDEKTGDVLQTEAFDKDPKKNPFRHSFEFAPADKDYTGQVLLDVYGYPEGSEEGTLVFSQSNLFVTAGEN